MKYTNESTYLDGEKHISFSYCATPSIIDKMNMVEDITDGVINEVNGYEPILYGYYVTLVMVDSLTNIKLPEDINDIADFFARTEIDRVLRDAIPALWEEIENAAEKKIKYRCKEFLNKSKLDELFSALISLINKYDKAFDGLDIKEVLTKMTSVGELVNMPETKIVEGILDYNKKDADNQQG